jgi:hypothetical protein
MQVNFYASENDGGVLPSGLVLMNWGCVLTADDRLEAVEAAGEESNLHSVSKLRDVENQLVEAQVLARNFGACLNSEKPTRASIAVVSAALQDHQHVLNHANRFDSGFLKNPVACSALPVNLQRCQPECSQWLLIRS